MAHHFDARGSDSSGPFERDELLEALFHEALQLDDEDERVDYARRHCAGDTELAEELSALLAAHGSAPACLDQPAWGENGAGLGDSAGDTVGPYHLLRTLGEGGMGTVYLAQQLRPLRRVVALKLIKAGMDTREVVGRFDAERQVLAQLNHPHIAAVYDAGITPRGRPYFAMEFVPGERITRYCDARKLPLRKRLLLFRSVCDAVHHAHQKGVIHRDLKPGNILVTEVDGKPVPKIIDFGVAKAIHGEAAAGGRGTLITRSGQIIGTPAYMSPEQAGAFPAPVDSRTDVYSLGVLLNELLTGFLPYELGSLRGANDEVVRGRLSEVEVVRPALRVALLGLRARKAAARRDCDPRGLSRQLAGDLDWIVLKALDRDPEARYASASELGADIANHLDGDPVTASSPGALYRARKLAAKNRGIVASVAVLLVTGFVALMSFALSEVGRNEELVSENEHLVTTHDAEMQAVLDREDTLLAACDAARDEAGEELSYTTTVIRNVGDSALQVGELVELVGVGESPPLGGLVVDVVRASAESGRPPLGSMDGLWAEEPVHAGHAHRLAGPVPPGSYGVAVTHGLFARVRVDGACGEIRPNDLLGVSTIPGLACLYSGEGPVVGYALDAWTVSQSGLIRAFVAPMPDFVTAQVAVLDPALSRMDDLLGTGLPGPAQAASSGAQDTSAVQAPDGSAELSEEGSSGLASAWQDSALFHRDVQLSPASAVVVMPQELPSAAEDLIEAPANPAPPLDSTDLPAPLPFAPRNLSVVMAEGAGRNGVSTQQLRIGGVGKKHAPGDTGGSIGTPPGSGDPPVHGGGVGSNQSGGENLELTNDSESGSDGDGDSFGGGTDGAVNPAAGKTASGLVLLWGDVDADGLQDVLIQAGAEPLVLHRNVGSGAFDDITDWSGLGELSARVGRPVAWIDSDQDGRLDLLSLGDDGRLVLFRGRGEGRFDEVFEAAGLSAATGVQDASVFDIDDDGAPDVRVTTAGHGVELLLNDGEGRFQRVVLRTADGSEEGVTEGSSLPTVAPLGG